MPGDEVHEEAGASAYAALDADSGDAGPRHAAPRKPLLTRLHVPAGKAIALAAMPSAVLMGMGLTPQLANAKPMPKSPFKPGPCVSQQDKDAEEEAQKEEAQKEKAEQEKQEKAEARKDKAEAERKKEAEEKDDKSASPAPDSPSEKPSETAPPTGDDESAEPEKEKKDPLDPLGLGDKIKDAFTPEEEKEKAAEESAAAESSASEKAPEPSASKKDESAGADSSKGLAGAAEHTVGEVGDGVENTTGELGKGAVDTTQDVKDKLPGGKQSEAGASGTDGNGDKAYPCVEEKKADGKDEQTPATLPNDPWQLEASSLGLHGLDYQGVVNVKTANGGSKQALKFTADSLDIGDLHQTVMGPDGTKYHVKAAKGSTSTIKGGKVTMYTEELKGNLFGLIPITFDPEHPPPLNIAEAYFTKVKVTQAGQFGGNLHIPGLSQYVD